MWTYVVSTKSDEKVPDLVSSVKPDFPGDEKQKEVKSSEKNATLVRSVAPQAFKSDPVVNNSQVLVKHNGAFLAAGNVSRKKTQGVQKGRMVNKGGKGNKGKVFALTEQDKLFNDTGFPPPYHVPTNNAVFNFTQNVESTNFAVSSASVSTFSANSFTVASLDQISSLTNVFDQYRIALVEVWLTPRTTISGSGNPNLNTGLFHSVVDYDDATVLGSIGSANDYANVMVSAGLVGHYRRFVPHIAVSAYNGSFGAFANVRAPWIDAASTAVQHYGLKTAWTVTDVVYTYDLIVRLHTQWRNVR